MKKLILIVGVSFCVVILIFFLGLTDSSGRTYKTINNIFPHIPDKACSSDEECILVVHPEWTQCEVYFGCGGPFNITNERVIAINKEWRPFCPFPGPIYRWLISCTPYIENSTKDLFNPFFSSQGYAQCIDHTCQKVLQ